MPRPKGSKNRKIEAPSASTTLTEQLRETELLLSENAQMVLTLTERIKADQKELQRMKREAKKLKEKQSRLTQAQADREAEQALLAKKAEAAQLVETILAKGKTADEILSMLA